VDVIVEEKTIDESDPFSPGLFEGLSGPLIGPPPEPPAPTVIV
jgi:hypothetical protein